MSWPTLIRFIFLGALVLGIPGPSQAQSVVRTPLPGGHPFLGQWRIDLPQFNCYEEYDVRADGTRSVTAGQEQAESEFEFSLVPSSKGFYKWTDKTTKDNGKPDCTGDIGKVGHVATSFVIFHRDGNQFLLCEDESLKGCFGPYVRKRAVTPEGSSTDSPSHHAKRTT